MADIDVLMPLIKQFMPFAKEQMGFNRPPKLFLKGDSSNAADPLGKTGFYDPQAESITLYITDRHPKDILRSLSHELMHHTQNCRGDFTDTGEMGEGYAQNNPHMRNMEIEAYKASICFRDWEDSLKETIYYEHLQKGDKTMSTKDWKNGELKSLLTEAWGFNMDLGKLNEVSEEDPKAPEEETEGDAGTATEKEDLEEQGRAGLKSKASAAFDELDTQPAATPVATKPTPTPAPTSDVDTRAASAHKTASESPVGTTVKVDPETGGKTTTTVHRSPDWSEEDTALAADLEKSFGLEESLDEMRGPGHDEAEKLEEDSGEEEKRHYEDDDWHDKDRLDAILHHADELRKDMDHDHDHEELEEMCGPEAEHGAEVVVMGDEEGVVGDEAADPAARVEALMDELKGLLLQLAGGGDMEEVPMDEKRARGRRDARHVVGREDDDRKRPGDMSEAREVQLREMVRKAIREAMK